MLCEQVISGGSGGVCRPVDDASSIASSGSPSDVAAMTPNRGQCFLRCQMWFRRSRLLRLNAHCAPQDASGERAHD